MNRFSADEVSAIAPQTHLEGITEHEQPFLSRQLVQSNLQKSAPIQPFSKKYQLTNSIDQILLPPRKHKLFEKMDIAAPTTVKSTELFRPKKSKLQFKIPSIKEYYIEEQLIQPLPKTLHAFRMQSLIGHDQDIRQTRQKTPAPFPSTPELLLPKISSFSPLRIPKLHYNWRYPIAVLIVFALMLLLAYMISGDKTLF